MNLQARLSINNKCSPVFMILNIDKVRRFVNNTEFKSLETWTIIYSECFYVSFHFSIKATRADSYS